MARGMKGKKAAAEAAAMQCKRLTIVQGVAGAPLVINQDGQNADTADDGRRAPARLSRRVVGAVHAAMALLLARAAMKIISAGRPSS